MLAYVEALTVSPPQPRLEHIERLRELGFEDQAIFEINQIAGFFAWVNRTVQGLGVELEEFWDAEEPDNR